MFALASPWSRFHACTSVCSRKPLGLLRYLYSCATTRFKGAAAELLLRFRISHPSHPWLCVFILAAPHSANLAASATKSSALSRCTKFGLEHYLHFRLGHYSTGGGSAEHLQQVCACPSPSKIHGYVGLYHACGFYAGPVAIGKVPEKGCCKG